MKKFLNYSLILVFISILLLPSIVFAKENLNKIDLNVEGLDDIDNSYTGKEAKWAISYSGRENSHVSSGNKNKWMHQCPTSDRCLLNEGLVFVENDKLTANKYSYIELEVFADEFGMNLDNPSYDFDKDNLEALEVWVNGTKREDAIVDDYNNSWRMVHVFIPVTVSEYTGEYYTVTFNTNGGSAIESQSVAENHYVVKPEEKPTKAGQVFTEWYRDEELTEAFDFYSPITSNTTIYAGWRDAVVTQMIDTIKLDFSISQEINDTTMASVAKSYISYNGSENSHVSKGNGNKWILQCPTSERCSTSELNIDNENPLSSGRYTFAELEVFADEFGMNLDNPTYDFDKDNLEALEVWINGTKREDVIVHDYNNSWRMVHVLIPITVKSSVDNYYTVTFNTNGGNSISSQSIIENGKVLAPEDPIRTGYKFVNWYKDSSLTEKYNFNDSVTSNITLYAKWNQILTSAGAHISVPVRGNTAPIDITSDDESKYTVKIDYWYLSDKAAGYPHISETDILEAGKTYKLRFIFTPKEGYVFNNEPTTTLNGKETKKYGIPSYCEYSFYIKDQLNQVKASTSSVKLEWEKNNDAKGYIVQVKSGSKWKTVKTITKKTTTTLTIKKLKAGTKYTYRVKAYKIVKKKKKTINTTNSVVAITTPKNPKVTLSLKDYNSMNIKISGVKGGNNYALEKSTDGKNYILFNRVFEPTTVTQENLELGKKYYYRVQACNANGYCSKWTTVSMKQTTLSPAFNLTTSKKKVTVTLTPVNEADGYEIYRATKKNGKYKVVKSLLSSDELVFVNGTKKGTKYYYKVRSYKIVGDKKVYSPYSKVKSIKSK